MCRLEEWDSMLNKFDNTWGIVKESGGPSFFLISISSTSISTYIFFFFVSSPGPSRDYQRAGELH